jgi:hypothetical protein
MNDYNSINYIGGDIIGHGGYGCVFRPPISCSSGKKKRNTISKIMLRRKGKEEFEQSKLIQGLLYNIKDYKKYFLLPSSICIPKKFRKQDIKNWDRKCKRIGSSKSITRKNINKKKNFLLNIISNDGGNTIEYFIKRINSRQKFNEFNNNLIELIKNAIIPMNEKGVYHFDLKSGNIVGKKNKNFQVIDWGISFIDHGLEDDEPLKLMNRRPIQFNIPYTNLLFHDNYQKAINTTANSNFGDISKDDAIECAEYIIGDYISKHGPGHIYYLRPICKNMFPEYSEIYLIKNFIALAIMEKQFYKQVDGKLEFDKVKYYKEVFKPNIDIFGVVSSYYNFYDNEFKKKIPNYLYDDIVNNLHIYLKPLIFDFPKKKIDTNYLFNQLKKINIATYNYSSSSKRSSKKSSSLRKKSKSVSKRKTRKNIIK